MHMHITLTEDEVLQMLADYLSTKLGRRVDPEHIEELVADCVSDNYLSLELQEENLGERLQAA